MAKYHYITEIIKNGKLIACSHYNSLKKQINEVFSFVRCNLSREEFPTYYIDETISGYSKALCKKNCSKKKYHQSFHNDNGVILKLIRVGMN